LSFVVLLTLDTRLFYSSSRCRCAANDECDRRGTLDHHELIRSSPFLSLFHPFFPRPDISYSVVTLLRNFAHRIVGYQNCTFHIHVRAGVFWLGKLATRQRKDG